MRKLPEILAPAGNFESLVAAVQSGADAVYLGSSGFNARASAANFHGDDLRRACDYCHSFGVTVYLTVNTLVYDREFNELAEVLKTAALSGVDAIIVQDMAVLQVAKQMIPDMELHSSTQQSITEKRSLLTAAKLGFSRAVVARELSKAELKELVNDEIEVEAFIHGAHCMSVSGQCYMSLFLGGRSGNRGNCAQPCRLPFKVGNDAKALSGYALSLKDMSVVERAGEFAEIGIAALKIEGRLKGPRYVSTAVTAVGDSLDGKTPDMNLLRNVFSRSGFTSGYFDGKLDRSMFGVRRAEDITSSKQSATEYTPTEERTPLATPITKQYEVKPFTFTKPKKQKNTTPKLRARFPAHQMLSTDLCEQFERITMPPTQLLKAIEKRMISVEKAQVEIPRIMFLGDEERLMPTLKKLHSLGVAYGVVGSLGATSLLTELGMKSVGGFSLNITNSLSLKTYAELGLCEAELSVEGHIKDLSAVSGDIKVGVIGYGHIPVMALRNCPNKSVNGCAECKNRNGSAFLTDRMGKQFKLSCNSGFCEVFNPVPLYMGDKPENLRGFDFATLYFTGESRQRCEEVTRLFAQSQPLKGDFTRGVYLKGLSKT